MISERERDQLDSTSGRGSSNVLHSPKDLSLVVGDQVGFVELESLADDFLIAHLGFKEAAVSLLRLPASLCNPAPSAK